MKEITDHLKRTIAYAYPPKRIISLVPAITETMCHLGLKENIVGRTRFCVFPNEMKKVRNVGGTKDIKMNRIHELNPDLIIAEKEENTKEIVETLEVDYPVFVFEIQTINDVLKMINDIGLLTNCHQRAKKLQTDIVDALQALPYVNGKRIAYVIWKKPYMVVGKHTYIQSLLDTMGFINPFTSFPGRYPIVSIKDLQNASLDYIFLATEPYPYREKHLQEFTDMLPNTTPMIINGEMFWYGAKMIQAVKYFQETFKHL
ncbi:MAG TPA: helical backbone metal receptor [Bacillota bacterium]|nr:helical backbone metal receptor [Bacillota bacterium]